MGGTIIVIFIFTLELLSDRQQLVCVGVGVCITLLVKCPHKETVLGSREAELGTTMCVGYTIYIYN